jgi:hypothetical protein
VTEKPTVHCHRYWGGWFARVTAGNGRLLHETCVFESRREAYRAGTEWVRKWGRIVL